MSRKEALSQFINQIHGRPVAVKLNNGVDYRGAKHAAPPATRQQKCIVLTF